MNQRCILEAVEYLNQCRRQPLKAAVLTAENRGAIDATLAAFQAQSLTVPRIIKLYSKTDNCDHFIESFLAQMGLDVPHLPVDDLLRLLLVVLRQSSNGCGADLVVVDNLHEFGPRVLERLCQLILGCQGWAQAPLFVLTGTTALHRVLDSIGMAEIAAATKRRFTFEPGSEGENGSGAGTGSSGGPFRGALLHVARGNEPMASRPIEQVRLLIGRAAHNDLCLPGRFVSRQHALLIHPADDAPYLIDLKSTNGTWVNSRPIDQQRLRNGDIIGIGNYRLRYECIVSRASPSSPAPDPERLLATAIQRPDQLKSSEGAMAQTGSVRSSAA